MKSEITPRPPLPPFTEETARQKVQAAEDAWNTRDPERVALAYTEDTEWRNRTRVPAWPGASRRIPPPQMESRPRYRPKKTLWAFTGNRIAVRFGYESHDNSGQWYHSYGNENWEFDQLGYMKFRFASINELRSKKLNESFAESRNSGRWFAHGVGLSFVEFYPIGVRSYKTCVRNLR